MMGDEFVVVGEGDPSLVLLPGWATDGRVFDGVFPGVPAVVAGPLRPEGFAGRLAVFLDRAVRGPVTVVGWSLGGFLAAEFAREYPDRVRRVVLVGIRRRYPAADLSAVRAKLLRDREACLSTFYAQCFFPTRSAAYRAFRSGLQREYLREMGDELLLSGLSYLASVDFTPAALPACPVAIVHGEKDAVAPAAEAESVARESGRASFHLFPGAAHAAFLADRFRSVAVDG